MQRRKWTPTLLLAAAMLLVAGVGHAMTVDRWLVAGPQTVPANLPDDALEYTRSALLLDPAPVNPVLYWPAEGEGIVLGPAGASAYTPGELTFERPEGRQARIAVAAAYLDAPAWQRGTVTVRSEAPFVLYLDDDEVLARRSVDEDAGELSAEVTLDQGKRRLILATGAVGGEVDDWKLRVQYEPGEEVARAWTPSTSLDPVHPFDINDYFLEEWLSGLNISPDGRYAAVVRGLRDPGTGEKGKHLELWDLDSRSMLWSYRTPEAVRYATWAPDSERLLIAMPSGSDSTTFYMADAATGAMVLAAEHVKGSSEARVAPAGEGFYYIRTVPREEEDDNKYTVLWGLQDRWEGWRDRKQIRYRDMESGADVLVMEGLYGPDAYDVSSDGSTMVVVRTLPRSERPFEAMEVLKLDLNSGELTSVATKRFQRDAYASLAVSPEGRYAAFAMPQYEVTGNDNENPEINDADRILYLLDLESGELTKVDPDFQPAADMSAYGTGKDNQFAWHDDGRLLFSAFYDKSILLCEYTPGGEIVTHELATPGASQMDYATDRGATRIVYQADRLNVFPHVNVQEKIGGEGVKLFDLGEKLKQLTTPAVKAVDYDYVNSDGVTIPGYLYYPRGYDPDGSYPMIIDFYGGVIGFGDGWAWDAVSYANRGYFVYVPVPRGAAGYGKDFAHTHPGDWGRLTSRDINEGVRHIVKNVPGVDGSRVAPVSGSYGGFLTMYMLAMDEDHPDYYPYATGISHAGISMIASYWGQGWWGYLYNDMAAGGVTPMQNPDLYERWSPLYRAENIDVPLLLTHGDADINVPTGESQQMYTALKVLDRDVTLVLWEGGGHGVTEDMKKMYLVNRRMRIEWFDKHLRNRPGAWDWRMSGEMTKPGW